MARTTATRMTPATPAAGAREDFPNQENFIDVVAIIL
jgi:hypothetical protein